MSEVFEGIVSKVPVATVRSVVSALLTPFELTICDLPDGCSVLYRNDTRQSSRFSEEMDRLARTISESISTCLLVRYDSRIGHRSSSLYSSGRLIRNFGEADELFVPLGEDGFPV